MEDWSTSAGVPLGVKAVRSGALTGAERLLGLEIVARLQVSEITRPSPDVSMWLLTNIRLWPLDPRQLASSSFLRCLQVDNWATWVLATVSAECREPGLMVVSEQLAITSGASADQCRRGLVEQKLHQLGGNTTAWLPGVISTTATIVYEKCGSGGVLAFVKWLTGLNDGCSILKSFGVQLPATLIYSAPLEDVPDMAEWLQLLDPTCETIPTSLSVADFPPFFPREMVEEFWLQRVIRPPKRTTRTLLQVCKLRRAERIGVLNTAILTALRCHTVPAKECAYVRMHFSCMALDPRLVDVTPEGTPYNEELSFAQILRPSPDFALLVAARCATGEPRPVWLDDRIEEIMDYLQTHGGVLAAEGARAWLKKTATPLPQPLPGLWQDVLSGLEPAVQSVTEQTFPPWINLQLVMLVADKPSRVRRQSLKPLAKMSAPQPLANFVVKDNGMLPSL